MPLSRDLLEGWCSPVMVLEHAFESPRVSAAAVGFCDLLSAATPEGGINEARPVPPPLVGMLLWLLRGRDDEQDQNLSRQIGIERAAERRRLTTTQATLRIDDGSPPDGLVDRALAPLVAAVAAFSSGTSQTVPFELPRQQHAQPMIGSVGRYVATGVHDLDAFGRGPDPERQQPRGAYIRVGPLIVTRCRTAHAATFNVYRLHTDEDGGGEAILGGKEEAAELSAYLRRHRDRVFVASVHLHIDVEEYDKMLVDRVVDGRHEPKSLASASSVVLAYRVMRRVVAELLPPPCRDDTTDAFGTDCVVALLRCLDPVLRTDYYGSAAKLFEGGLWVEEHRRRERKLRRQRQRGGPAHEGHPQQALLQAAQCQQQ